MSSVRSVGIVAIVAMLVAACATPPVTPMPEAARRSVTAISGDVSGIKASDMTRLGARGSSEGGRLGAAAGAYAMGNSGGGLVALLLMPAALAVGGATGAAAARPEDVVDDARASLRIAIQDTDFTEMLRSRLVASTAGGNVRIVALTSGASGAPLQPGSGTPPSHLVALEYRLTLYSEELVNPKIGIFVQAKVQVMSADRKQVLHTAVWNYCGDRRDFVDMAASQASVLRGQMDNAATTLAQAIPYDLFVSNQPRHLAIKFPCMDFTDLPASVARVPAYDDQQRRIEEAPKAHTAAAVPPPAMTAPLTPVAATVAPAASPFDGSYSGPFVFSGGMASYGAAFGRSVSIAVLNGNGNGTLNSSHCGSAPVSLTISPAGDITGQASGFDIDCGKLAQSVRGSAAGGKLQLTFINPGPGGGTATLTLNAATPR